MLKQLAYKAMNMTWFQVHLQSVFALFVFIRDGKSIIQFFFFFKPLPLTAKQNRESSPSSTDVSKVSSIPSSTTAQH